jgi:hypothetical protein
VTELADLVPVGVILHLLDGVPLRVEVNQLPAPLVNLFLNRLAYLFTDLSFNTNLSSLNSGAENSFAKLASLSEL